MIDTVSQNAFMIRRVGKAALTFLALNAAWEAAQVPLYTIWKQNWREIAFALVHCTLGDLLIGIVIISAWAVVIALLTGSRPKLTSGLFLGSFLVLGVGYTVFSEWLNVEVRASWAYSEKMPVVPPLGTGLAPLLQWLIIPTLTWALLVRQHRS